MNESEASSWLSEYIVALRGGYALKPSELPPDKRKLLVEAIHTLDLMNLEDTGRPHEFNGDLVE